MNNHSILVIDDEPVNFDVVKGLLAPENYHVYYIGSGKEALVSLDIFNPDVILLDVMMPEMDGLEVCERLKLMRKWRSTPIIMLTGLSEKTAISKCLQAGADDFISKPVRGVELRARVKSMLRIKKQFDRIESLTKLQQDKITVLESDLVALGLDLAVDFANELNDPLHSIIDRFEDLIQIVGPKDHIKILDSLKLGRQSAIDLERLTSKFGVYIELAIERKQFDNNETFDIKKNIEEISEFKLQEYHREHALRFKLDNIPLAISLQHGEWIVQELLDNALQFSIPGTPFQIKGWKVDDMLHLQFSYHLSPDFINRSIEEQELVISLKIIKKIVSIYNGLFSFSHVGLHHRMVYITLPLA
jgi:two-component system, sensor histidine kinase and response regulator